MTIGEWSNEESDGRVVARSQFELMKGREKFIINDGTVCFGNLSSAGIAPNGGIQRVDGGAEVGLQSFRNESF